VIYASDLAVIQIGNVNDQAIHMSALCICSSFKMLDFDICIAWLCS